MFSRHWTSDDKTSQEGWLDVCGTGTFSLFVPRPLISYVYNIILHFPCDFDYRKIILYFQLPDPSGTLQNNFKQKKLANIIYANIQLWSGSTEFSAESTWTPICHMHAWQRVLDPPTATATAQSHLVLHTCNRCSHKCLAKVLPCNTLQVSFDAKTLHTLSSTTHTLIQHKKIPKYWAHIQYTSSNHWQSPYTWVGYNFVPQCLP